MQDAVVGEQREGAYYGLTLKMWETPKAWHKSVFAFRPTSLCSAAHFRSHRVTAAGIPHNIQHSIYYRKPLSGGIKMYIVVMSSLSLPIYL